MPRARRAAESRCVAAKIPSTPALKKYRGVNIYSRSCDARKGLRVPWSRSGCFSFPAGCTLTTVLVCAAKICRCFENRSMTFPLVLKPHSSKDPVSRRTSFRAMGPNGTGDRHPSARSTMGEPALPRRKRIRWPTTFPATGTSFCHKEMEGKKAGWIMRIRYYFWPIFRPSFEALLAGPQAKAGFGLAGVLWIARIELWPEKGPTAFPVTPIHRKTSEGVASNAAFKGMGCPAKLVFFLFSDFD